MSWKYQSELTKRNVVGKTKCLVHIYCDDWELYERIVKIIENEIENDG